MKLKHMMMALLLGLGSVMTASAALIIGTGTKPSVGNGNSGNPYEIRTAEELRWFVHYENTRHWFPNEYAKLMADIDLSSICGPDKGSWIPLGVAEESGAIGDFYGYFDGNGHTVSGMYIDGKDTEDIDSRAGFFGMMTSGSVCDLTVEGDIINASYAKYVGGMVAKIETKTNIYAYKDLEYTNCEARVNIWYEEKDGPQSTLRTTNHYVGGFLGNSNTKDGITMSNCVFSGDINFDNASAYSAVGAFIGILKNNKTANLQYCSAATSLKLPFIQYVEGLSGSLKLNLTGCVNRGPMAYKLDRKGFDIYFTFTHCIYSDRLYEVPADDDNGRIVDADSYRYDDPEIFTNGFACYFINTIAGGKYFTQTLGTDKMPFPGSSHATVYRVKKYTQCGSDNWEWAYSNTDEDDTTHREHLFDADHAYCTRCGEAVNPDYGVAKDAEGYYLAATAEDIKWLWNLVNVTGVTDANIRLTADIDMKGEAMQPLALYSGELDGQNHTLSNININCTGVARVGLVGKLTGTIRNLTLTGTVEGSYASYMGAFAAYVWKGAKISNVRNDCTVKATGTVGGDVYSYIGGVAGYSDGSITYAINNGPVVDASVCTGTLKRYIAGVAGYVIPYTEVSHLANNGVVGATDASQNGAGAAVVNVSDASYYTDSYYVAGFSNPGLEYFFSDNPATATDTSVSPVDVGSGRLAWLLAGKDYDADDSNTVFFGQTIGTDLVPYPFVSENHKGVYHARHYYTCDSYSDYSNSPTDEEQAAHKWNDNHYCDVCCAIDPEYVSQDAQKAYKIFTPAQYNIFAAAVNAAYLVNKPTQYASASLQANLDFSSGAPTVIKQLSGRIHGNGHKVTLGILGSNSSLANVATTVKEDGIIEYLDVVFPSDGFYPMVYENLGRIVGCNITRGIPAGNSAGLVIDCSGELPSSKSLYGRYTRCLIKTYTTDGADAYRLYNSNVAYNEVASYTEIPLEKGLSGELAYMLSHGGGNCEWGQDLGTDLSPRIYRGQTPASDTYVTRLTSYAVDYPEGNVEYMNAGADLKATPGYYKVCEDTESWTSHPSSNFIIDNGDGSYFADNLDIAPLMAHFLPISVLADKFSYSEAFEEGNVVSLVFPVEMPVSKINGKVYLFKGYNATQGKLEFVSSGNIECIPAHTPMLVKAYGGEILYYGCYAESYSLEVGPMTVAALREVGDYAHMAGYQRTVLPAAGDVCYYKLSGVVTRDVVAAAPANITTRSDASLSAVTAAEGTAVSPFDSYFAVPAGATLGATIPVVLGDEVPTGIGTVGAGIGTVGAAYNLLGLPVTDSYRGIVIVNGKKQLRK